MSREAAIYLARLAGERLLGLGLFLLGSGGRMTPAAWLFFVCYFLFAVLSGAGLREHSDTLAARARVNRDTPLWDKIILTAFWLLAYFVIFFLAGRGCGDEGAIQLSTLLAAALYGASTWLTAWALASNAYAESTARLQPERRQKVARGGPYALVRHPMYSAILLWCVAIVLFFPAGGVLATAFVVAALIVTRTALEDKMLRTDLPGYDAYARQTRWRLIPYIW